MDNLQELLKEHLQVLQIGVLLALITFWIGWKRGFFKISDLGTSPQPRLRFSDPFFAFVIFLTIEILIVPLIAIFWVTYFAKLKLEGTHLHLDTSSQGWVNVLAIYVSALGIGIYFFLLRSEARKAIWGSQAFLGFWKVVKDLLVGFSTWLISYPAALVIGQIVAIAVLLFFQTPVQVEQTAVKNLKAAISDPVLYWVMMLSIIFIVPVIEEVLFRGFLQTWLKQKLGRKFAIFITAFTFALFHFTSAQGIENFELITSLFVLGCFLGFLFERQKSLWAPIGLHATFNGISVMMIMLQTS